MPFIVVVVRRLSSIVPLSSPQAKPLPDNKYTKKKNRKKEKLIKFSSLPILCLSLPIPVLIPHFWDHLSSPTYSRYLCEAEQTFQAQPDPTKKKQRKKKKDLKFPSRSNSAHTLRTCQTFSLPLSSHPYLSICLQSRSVDGIFFPHCHPISFIYRAWTTSNE